MTHHEPTGVVLLDTEGDVFRHERRWTVVDPESGQRRVLRLRVARGVVEDMESAESVNMNGKSDE